MKKRIRSRQQIQKELNAAKKRHADIDTEVASHEAAIEALKSESRDLYGCYGGKIRELVEELDGKKPRVVWANTNYGGDYVVEKVTAKMIFIRPYGRQIGGFLRLHRHRLDGRCDSNWNRSLIDIRKTFGIDADSVPPNWKQSK